MMHPGLKLKEPTIDELMSDEIITLLMQKDGVEKDPLMALLRETAGLIGQSPFHANNNYPAAM